MSGSFPSSLPDSETTLEISPRAVAGWYKLPVNQRPRLIDCREEDELAICQIEGNEWHPLGDFPRVIDHLRSDTERGIVVYCHHGMRSQRAAAFLRAHGVSHAFSMSGGIDLWSDIIDPSVPKY